MTVTSSTVLKVQVSSVPVGLVHTDHIGVDRHVCKKRFIVGFARLVANDFSFGVLECLEGSDLSVPGTNIKAEIEIVIGEV